MLDALSLDQLRTFIAAAEEGSFSAAARRLRRAQSAVSQTLRNLEVQLGLQLFDRAGRYPKLTDAGNALLKQARIIIDGMDEFKSKARVLAGGLEPELSVVVDVLYPMDRLTAAVDAFRAKFPDTALRLYVEALGAVAQRVLEATCRLGISGSMMTVPDPLTAEKLVDVLMITVASPSHPLARRRSVIPNRELQRHVQLVLTDRTSLTEGKTFGVLSPLVWKLADLGAKHSFLKAGFGWGHMPEAMVRDDVASGKLVVIETETYHGRLVTIDMFGIYRKDLPPGPAGRWLLDYLRQPAQ